MNIIKNFFQEIIDFCSPKKCIGCGEAGINLCEKCNVEFNKIEIIENEFQHYNNKIICTSLFPYNNQVISQAIKQGKYHNNSWVWEKLLGNIDFNNLKKQFGENCLLVPIPLHWFRINERGFNQAELIAEILEKNGIGIKQNCLKRIINTKQQASLKDNERRIDNVKNCFKLISEPEQNKTIIIIDDVATTGATLCSAVSCFPKHHKVVALTIAGKKTVSS